MERHYSLDDLDRYAADPASVTDRDALDIHLDVCAECRTALNDARSFIADLSSDEVWQQTEELLTGAAASPLVALKERIDREDTEAGQLLRRPLKSPLRFVWANVAQKRRYRTGGVVRLLCRLSREVREENTLHARNLAEAAAAIADSLPDGYYPARGVNHLRGLAWKEVANALRYLGELRAAHDAVDRAARAYRRLPANELELASVEYVRGTVLWKEQRFDEALRCARQSGTCFARMGEHDRWTWSRLLEASILQDTHDSASARDVLTALASDSAATSDPETAARIQYNLANVYGSLGDSGNAAQHLVEAVKRYEELRMLTEAARGRWRLANLFLPANAAEAERRLRLAVAELERLSLSGDAALARLDLVEALIRQGRNHEVPALCTELVSRFTASGTMPAALMAVAFLREVAVGGKLSVEQVQYVRTYVGHVEDGREMLFAPPSR